MNGKYRPFLTVQAPVFAGYFESLVYRRPIEPSQSGIGRAEEASKPYPHKRMDVWAGRLARVTS
jgi:hypothetical protein